MNTKSTEYEIAYNVVGHFHSFYLSPRTAQSEFVCDLWTRFTGDKISDYGIMRTDDMIESNSYHILWIRPSHDFGASWGMREVPRKDLEVPKSPCIKGATHRRATVIMETHIRRGKH